MRSPTRSAENLAFWQPGSIPDHPFGLSLLGIGKVRVPKKAFFSQTRLAPRSYFSFCYLSRGRGLFQRGGGRPLAVTAGDLLFRLPGYPHRLGPERGDDWQEYWVALNGFLMEEWLRRGVFHPDTLVLPWGLDECLVGDLEACLQWVAQGRWDGPELTGRLAVLMAGILPRLLASVKEVPVSSAARLARDVQRSMERNLDTPRFQLAQVEPMLTVGYHTLRALFRRETGESLQACFRRLKLQAAALRLAETDDRIQDIAQTLGFCDPFEFSKRFRHAWGLSPRAYRQDLRAHRASYPPV